MTDVATPLYQHWLAEYRLVADAGFSLKILRRLPARTVEAYAIIHDERTRLQQWVDDETGEEG